MINVLMQNRFDEARIEELEKKYGLKIYFMKDDELPDQGVLDKIEVFVSWRLKNAIELMPNLKWIHFHMAGVDRYIKLFRSLDKLPKITNGSGTYDIAISEHAVSMLLSISRNLMKYTQNQKDHNWKNEGRVKEINGSVAGIVGFGSIGSYTAKLLNAFGAKVYAHKVSKIEKPNYVDKMFYGDKGIEEMLPECDFVLLSLPGTDKTKHLFDRDKMLLIKKGAIITNVGRGNVIDCNALAELIEQRHIFGAGLDVTDPEPLPEDHKLWDMENVLITPHISYLSPQLKPRMLDIFEANLKEYTSGRRMPNEVDFSKGY